MENYVQLSLFEASEGLAKLNRADDLSAKSESHRVPLDEYEAFLAKFEAKKTTDDCYTPAAVYTVVLDFVSSFCDLTGKTILRPFFPGGDYQAQTYADSDVVIDNPPFSILTKILRFYTAHHVPFFLFGPSLTLFLAPDCDLTYIIADADITYANGAKVRTGFITNMIQDLRVWVCPQLKKAIDEAQSIPGKTKKGFVYPDNIITAATIQKLAAHGTELKIYKDSCLYIKDSDSAKAAGRSLFGGGFILSDQAAAERAAAERAAAERAAATRLLLSKRELSLVAELNNKDKHLRYDQRTRKI